MSTAHRSVFIRLVAVVGLVLAAASTSLASAGPANAASVGYVRLAHLSPDTPQVDVWLTSFRGDRFSKVLRGVSYGTLSPYDRIAEGRYTISMRKPGAAADSPPVLSTSLTVAAGGVYTVAGVGPNKALNLKVLRDDVSRPQVGTAKVRVVQASSQAPVVDVTTKNGAEIAKHATFPSATVYADVPAQRWTLQVKPVGGDAQPIEQQIDVTAGSTFTLLVLDKKDGGLQLLLRQDSASASRVPAGAVAAGQGGGSPAPRGPGAGWLLVLSGVGLAAAAGAVARNRRPASERVPV